MVFTKVAGFSIVAGVAAIGAVAIAGLRGVAGAAAGMAGLAVVGGSIAAVVVILADSIFEIDFRM